jgi:hypothetical protein
MSRCLQWYLILVSGMSQAGWSSDTLWPVVVRDHINHTSTLIQVHSKLFDSTAGSYIGTRPGIDGLPTPPVIWDPPTVRNRSVLQQTNTPPGWPGRIALRLDHQNVGGSFGQVCSGILIGPNYALTAAHCVNSRASEPIEGGWVYDSLYVRPGYDRGHDLPDSTSPDGYLKPVRVLKSWVSRTVFEYANEHGYKYNGDDDWAVMELERDVGKELGWAAVGPLKPGDENRNYHMLGYPGKDPCSGDCDTVSRRDSLSHSYTPVEIKYWDPVDFKEIWSPLVTGWFGESGSGFLDCPDRKCLSGRVTVRGTRWKEVSISAIDSIMSGVIATLLKDVTIPTSSLTSFHQLSFDLGLKNGLLSGSSDREGEWQILSLDGRLIGSPSFGKSFAVATDRLPHGVTLIVFRAPGEVPVTRRWVAR